MKPKVLLADGSISIQKVVDLTFSDEGIEVVSVGNGELAIRKIEEIKPALADIYMLGQHGYEVCKYIKTNPRFAQIPVLLLVGAFEPFDQAEAIHVKADGHLTKPFESRALVTIVKRLLPQVTIETRDYQPVNLPPANSSMSFQGLLTLLERIRLSLMRILRSNGK